MNKTRQSATITEARPDTIAVPGGPPNTYWVYLRFDRGGSQGFGGPYLPDGAVKLFENDLLEAAGCKSRLELSGVKCVALYARGQWNEPIAGIEFANGKRFTIDGFRRKHFGPVTVMTPYEAALKNAQDSVTYARRRLDEAVDTLQNLRSEDFVDWSLT